MHINWNLYFARYQRRHGGIYFGSNRERVDCQLVLTENEKAPILACVDTVPAGKYHTVNIIARTSVYLNGEYHLKLGAANAVIGGVKGLAGMLGGGGDYGYPEVTKSRAVTTNNKPFTKQVLGDLDFRNALLAQKKVCVTIWPDPLKDGWHMVEVEQVNFDGLMADTSDWVTDAMSVETFQMERGEKEAVDRRAQDDFEQRMDAFLDLLRVAARAVTTWRM